MVSTQEGSDRWSSRKIALVLYLPAVGAVAVNLYFLSLMGRAIALPSLSPGMAVLAGLIGGIPAALWAGRWVRGLMDEADAKD